MFSNKEKRFKKHLKTLKRKPQSFPFVFYYYENNTYIAEIYSTYEEAIRRAIEVYVNDIMQSEFYIVDYETDSISDKGDIVRSIHGKPPRSNTLVEIMITILIIGLLPELMRLLSPYLTDEMKSIITPILSFHEITDHPIVKGVFVGLALLISLSMLIF